MGTAHRDDRLTHALALWGGSVASLDSLEIRGAVYPTLHFPFRQYGRLHTFFDPDAWSVCAVLSYSGVPELEAEARDVIELSLAHLTPDGLVPHHFDGIEPRQRIGDRERFVELFEAVRGDLLRLIWLRERYDAAGELTRAPGYHEYPDITDMVLREGIYGVTLDPLALTVNPMTREPFAVRFGRVRVVHSPEHVHLRAPGDHVRAGTVHGLTPCATYAAPGAAAVADEAMRRRRVG